MISDRSVLVRNIIIGTLGADTAAVETCTVVRHNRVCSGIHIYPRDLTSRYHGDGGWLKLHRLYRDRIFSGSVAFRKIMSLATLA